MKRVIGKDFEQYLGLRPQPCACNMLRVLLGLLRKQDLPNHRLMATSPAFLKAWCCSTRPRRASCPPLSCVQNERRDPVPPVHSPLRCDPGRARTDSTTTCDKIRAAPNDAQAGDLVNTNHAKFYAVKMRRPGCARSKTGKFNVTRSKHQTSAHFGAKLVTTTVLRSKSE